MSDPENEASVTTDFEPHPALIPESGVQPVDYGPDDTPLRDDEAEPADANVQHLATEEDVEADE